MAGLNISFRFSVCLSVSLPLPSPSSLSSFADLLRREILQSVPSAVPIAGCALMLPPCAMTSRIRMAALAAHTVACVRRRSSLSAVAAGTAMGRR